MVSKFTWKGATFTVSPMSVYLRDHIGYIYNDVGLPIAIGYGFDKLDDIPNTLSIVLADYIDWMLCTTIEGDVPFPTWGRWLDYSIAKNDKFADFKAWQSVVHGEDGELLDRWSSTYKEANLKPVTEKDEKKGNNSGQ